MRSIQQIFEKHIPDEDTEFIISAFDSCCSDDDYDRMQVMKDILSYNLDFGMELIDHMSTNDGSRIVREYASDLLLEISAIKADRPFNPDSFELIDRTIYGSIQKFLETKNAAKVTDYVEKPAKLATVKEKPNNEPAIVRNIAKKPEPAIRPKTTTPRFTEYDLIEGIANSETEIFEFLLNNTLGLRSILELLESVEEERTPLSQVLKNPEDHGHDENSQIDSLSDIINSVRETYHQNEQLRGKLFEDSIDGKDKHQIRRGIAKRSKELGKLMSDWHFREEVLSAIESAMKEEIDWYKDAKRSNIEEDAIREREATLKIAFGALLRDMVEIQRRRMTIKQAKEKLVNLTLPLVRSIARDYFPNYFPKSLDEERAYYDTPYREDLLGEGRIGLVEALNRFDFRKGFKFSDFSVWWIRQSIIAAVIDHHRMTTDIPEDTIEKIVDLNTTAKSLVYRLGREPLANEIADEMGIDVNQVELILSSAISPGKREAITAESDLAADLDLDKVRKMLKIVPLTKKPKAEARQEDASPKGITGRKRFSAKELTVEELEARTESSIERELAKTLSHKDVKRRRVYLQLEMPIEQVSSSNYTRNPYVSELAKRRAKGCCQLCERPAPFNDKDGNPYLETHHIIWLSQGGEDTIENTVALCPNCHRKLHILPLQSDIDRLLKKTSKAMWRLI